MREALRKANNAICKVSGALISLIIVALILLNITQMITRYFISFTFTWAEEVSIMVLLYMTAIGAPWVVLRRGHLKMDATEKLLTPRMKVIAHWGLHALLFMMSIVFIYSGWMTMKANQGYTMSVLRFDEVWRYVPLFLEGILMLIAEIITFLEDIIDLREGRLVIK